MIIKSQIIKLRKKALRHKILLQNFSYLSALQVFNMLLPLITYPYLIRILGKETYGLVIFAQAVIGYLVILVSFGFNISATKEVSVHRNNKEKLSEIVSSVFIIKGAMLLISFFILTVLLYLIPESQGYKMLFFLTMWMCLYEMIFPIFYFQGVEKMKYMTFLNLISRLFFLIFIFILIKSKSDYLLVPTINGIGAMIAGIISLIILKQDKIKLKPQPIFILLVYLKKSYIMAIAYASNTFKSNFNLIAIKFLFSFSEVAYFDLALKISNIGTMFLNLISQTVFPKMSREKNKNFFKKILSLSFAISILYVIFIQIFSNRIIILLGGAEMSTANHILKILVFFVPVYIIGAMLGRNWLLVHNFDKQVLLSMVYSSLIYVLIMCTYYFGKLDITLTEVTLIFIFSYSFETLYRYFICKSKNLL